MADQYNRLKALHHSLPPFAPTIPTSLLPFVAAFCLLATFALTFYFSTLPTHRLSLKEPAVALLASALGGFGVVALFCSVGRTLRCILILYYFPEASKTHSV